jgi:GAF domain-containing protein
MFVALADVVGSEAGIVDVLHELSLATRLIPGVSDTGILLADETGTLRVMASASERADQIGMLQLGAGSGPCIDCFASGRPVNIDEIGSAADAWPAYYRAAVALDVQAVHAMPLRLRERTIGVMSLFSRQPGGFTDGDVALAQAFGDAATIAILQIRTSEGHRRTEHQLQAALASRVLIEQAKGIIAGARKIPVDDAFDELRDHARATRTRLHDVAERVVNHELEL